MANILVVDDEPDVRELFNITLKMAGHSTETVKDGQEAADRLSGGSMPDLILLDLMMPRLDGYGVLKVIRETHDSKPVRVLVATAKVLEDADHQKLSSWPVVGVLNKGELDIGQMVSIVANALAKSPLKAAEQSSPPGKDEKGGAGEQQPTPPKPDEKKAAATPQDVAPKTDLKAASTPKVATPKSDEKGRS